MDRNEGKMVKEYATGGGSDILSPAEEKAELAHDMGFFGHMGVNKLKTNHKKAKPKYQRSY